MPIVELLLIVALIVYTIFALLTRRRPPIDMTALGLSLLSFTILIVTGSL